jgi:hypothetical protein
MPNGGSEPVAAPAGAIARARRLVAVHGVPLALVGAGFVHALATSWRKWGNLFVDGGREMVQPLRLLQGGELYRTVRHWYGPLPAWINAELYAVFGVHLDVLVAAGVLSAAAMTLALYGLALRFVGRWTAAAVATWFVYVSAFAHLIRNASFNFVIPYAYAATYGILAATLSLLFAVRHLQRGRDLELGVSLVFAVAAALCKIESALAVFAAHAALLVGGAAAGLLTRRRVALYAGAALALAGVYGGLTLRVGPGLWSENIFFSANQSIATYARTTMGLDDVAGSLRAMLVSALLMVAALGAGWASAWIASGPGRRRAGLSAAVAACAAAALLAAGWWTPLDVSLRALPLLGVGALGALAAAFVRCAVRRPALLPHLVLWAFALACLSRLGLRASPHHYGFYLTPVPVLAAVTVLTGVAGAAAGIRPWPRVSAAPALALLAGVGATCVATSWSWYETHLEPIASARGSLRLTPYDLELAPKALALLEALPQDARVIAVPVGTGLVFLSGRRWADTVFNYCPTDIPDDGASLVRRWSADPPDAVLFIHADMSEFGSAPFGVGYAQEAFRWLDENYVVAYQELPLTLLRRR